MNTRVREFFDRYGSVFRRALQGDTDMNELAQLYAPEFIASSPAGVASGKNDEQLKQVMAQGYARYRDQGMRDMQVRGVRVSAIDEDHCIAHVAWEATYAREGRPHVIIDFEVHYFVRGLCAEPKVFGWVSGDEEALLKKHGLA
jgi:hypothetical protein